MLVLSRKKNEAVVIGEGKKQVKITIVEIRGDRVRLGIEADKDVPVHREEILAQIAKEKGKDGTENVS